jgi:hypothetical protein
LDPLRARGSVPDVSETAFGKMVPVRTVKARMRRRVK